MRAGKLDKRIRVEVRSAGSPVPQDKFGEPIYNWSLVAEVWASKRDTRAGERYANAAPQVIADVDSVFTVRWAPFGATLQPDTHRITYGGATFNIVGVAEIGRRQGLEISTASRGERPV